MSQWLLELVVQHELRHQEFDHHLSEMSTQTHSPANHERNPLVLRVGFLFFWGESAQVKLLGVRIDIVVEVKTCCQHTDPVSLFDTDTFQSGVLGGDSQC